MAAVLIQRRLEMFYRPKFGREILKVIIDIQRNMRILESSLSNLFRRNMISLIDIEKFIPNLQMLIDPENKYIYQTKYKYYKLQILMDSSYQST